MTPWQTFNLIANFGLAGAIFVIWWFNYKQTSKILAAYQKDMAEMRQMYERNVDLVRSYESLAGDLKDVIMMSTQTLTRLNDGILANQYCPMVRINLKEQSR